MAEQIKSYEIELIPNYCNEEVIIKEVKRMGLISTGETRSGPFRGSDVPVVLDVKSTEKDIKKLNERLKKIKTDTYWIFEKCPTCGHKLNIEYL